jgi:hypothetical protein
MQAFTLGLLWLVLAPLSLWVLLRGRPIQRVMSVLTLIALEGATIALDHSGRHIELKPTPALAGTAPAEAGATVADVPDARDTQDPVPYGGRPTELACADRVHTVDRVRAERRGDRLRRLTISWQAAPEECGTATVAARRTGRTIELWAHQGDVPGGPDDARVLPVRIKGERAVVRLPLAPPPPARHAYTILDGRTGRVLPQTGRPTPS